MVLGVEDINNNFFVGQVINKIFMKQNWVRVL